MIASSRRQDKQEPASIRQTRKISSIEGLRGLLALWVVFGHTLAAAGLGANWRGPFAVLAAGGNAVHVFIIVSGFVIFYLLDSAREGYGQFIFRRALRLYPAYLICLMASVFVLSLEVQVYTEAPWPHSLNDGRVQIALASLAYLPQQLLAHLTMMHALLPDHVLPYSNYAILGPAWSLSLEWQFYIIAPALFWMFGRSAATALAAIALACAAHFLIGGNEGILPRHVPMFAFGIASYFVWREQPVFGHPLLMIIGVALAYLLTHMPAVVIWACVFLAALHPGALGARFVNAVLQSPVLLALGRWSYSIYISHALVLVLSMSMLGAVDAKMVGQWPFFGLLLVITVAGTLAVSVALYRFVEAPCIEWGRRAVKLRPERVGRIHREA